MKKNFFKKSMSALLALVMVMSVMAMMPLSASAEGTDDPATREAKLIPYHLANDGDLLYQVDFRGDSAFQPNRYLGMLGDQILGDTTQYIVNADGSELNIKGDETIGGSRFHWWGGVINGLEAGADKFYTMVYKVKPLDRVDGEGNAYSPGMNNSFSVGGWSADPDAQLNYSNYGNYGSIIRDANGDSPYGHETEDTRRMRINLQQSGIGKIYTANKLTNVDYTYFKQLDNSMPAKDADGYMTVMVEYDAPNNQIRSYYLISGTGSDKNDWQQVQKADFAHRTMNPDLSDDVIGYWSFCSYHIVNQSVKDVRYYRGEYCQSAPMLTVGSAAELADLNTTLNGTAFAEATTVRVQLTADIDMTNVAYTPVSTTKTIRFNGGGYTVSNLTIGTEAAPVDGAGLFATAGAGSSFRNLGLTDVAIYGNDVAAGLLANPAFGDLTVSNVAVLGDVTAATGIAGGLVGSNSDAGGSATEAANWIFTYCGNAATVTGATVAAGLVGAANGAIGIDASYCANASAVQASVAAAGFANVNGTDATVAMTGKVSNFFNVGELTVTADGGLTGAVIGTYVANGTHADNSLTLYNCFDISKRSNVGTNGAIAGTIGGTAVSLENCYGAVAAESAGTYMQLVGACDSTPTTATSGVAAATGERVMLSTGSIKLDAMINRLNTALATLSEVEMPYGGIADGKPRDYTWYYNEGALVEKGTADAPYEIANAAQFATLAALSNGFQDPVQVGENDQPVDFGGKYFKLTGDVDLTGYKVDPIKVENGTIVFDGNGKKISNWEIANTQNGGMFSAVGKNSVIKNLTLDNVDVTGNDVSAVLVAQAKAGLTVYNVTVTDTCSVTTAKGDVAAGIVATIIDEEATAAEENTVKITFCVNGASVTADKVVGGIIGKIKGNFNYQISHCVNKGALSVVTTFNDAFYVGGILGWADKPTISDGTEAYENAFIKSCYNTGTLTTPDTTMNCYVGGIAGYLNSISNAELTIVCCYDVSARQVSTTSDTKLANGGIAGGSSTDLTKFLDTSYATNAEGSTHPYTSVTAWGRNTSAQVDEYSSIVASVTAEILDGNGAASTIQAEMQKIDAAIVSLTEIVWNFVDPDDGSDDSNSAVDDTTNNNTDTTAAPADTTAAPTDTTATTEEPKKKGCGSALESTYAVIALVAVLGFAFVAKKREEN